MINRENILKRVAKLLSITDAEIVLRNYVFGLEAIYASELNRTSFDEGEFRDTDVPHLTIFENENFKEVKKFSFELNRTDDNDSQWERKIDLSSTVLEAEDVLPDGIIEVMSLYKSDPDCIHSVIGNYETKNHGVLMFRVRFCYSSEDIIFGSVQISSNSLPIAAVKNGVDFEPGLISVGNKEYLVSSDIIELFSHLIEDPELRSLVLSNYKIKIKPFYDFGCQGIMAN